jgi:hypothetical protein
MKHHTSERDGGCPRPFANGRKQIMLEIGSRSPSARSGPNGVGALRARWRLRRLTGWRRAGCGTEARRRGLEDRDVASSIHRDAAESVAIYMLLRTPKPSRLWRPQNAGSRRDRDGSPGPMGRGLTGAAPWRCRGCCRAPRGLAGPARKRGFHGPMEWIPRPAGVGPQAWRKHHTTGGAPGSPRTGGNRNGKPSRD